MVRVRVVVNINERIENWMTTKILFCLMMGCVIGCAALLEQGELVRVDQGMNVTKSGAYYPSRAQIYKFLLPKKRSIQKIVIHTNGPVPNVTVYVQKEKDMWHKIKEIKRPIQGSYELNIAATTDGIKLAQSGGRAKQRLAFGTAEIAEVTNIELYGSPGQN
ncbi:hypothetical protein H8E77_29890 [bacterium]|nr:hypothetical protein [bacterium]